MKTPSKPDWDSCSADVINELVTSKHVESRRAVLKRIGFTTALLFLAVASTTFWWASRKTSRDSMRLKMIIPIACDEVHENLAGYYHRQLDDAMMRRIRCHFKCCRNCKEEYLTAFEDAMIY